MSQKYYSQSSFAVSKLKSILLEDKILNGLLQVNYVNVGIFIRDKQVILLFLVQVCF